LRLGDRITLGPGGPVLIVAGLGTAPEMPVARPMGLIARALAWARADSRRKLGWLLVILLALMLLLAGALSSLYRMVSAHVGRALAAGPAPGAEAQPRVGERDLLAHHEDREVAAGGSGGRRDGRFGPGLLAGVARQRDGEARSLPGLRLHPDAAAVLAGDPVADGEPEARPDALGLGREERVEDLAADLGRDPRAGVGDLESGLAFVGARTNDDGAWS